MVGEVIGDGAERSRDVWILCYQRSIIARQFGTLRSMISFIFQEPVTVCTAVLCDHGLLVLGPGGSVLQGWKAKESGWHRRVRTTEGYLLVRQSFVYDGEWCTNAIAWYII